MILPSTPRSSNFPFKMLLSTPFWIVPWIRHYNVLSRLFILHSCSGVLSALQNKYTVMLKFSKNMFSVYVWILSVSSAAAISTTFTAVLCLNVFLTITSIYQPTNAHIISCKTLLKHFKTLRHVSILSDHHQGALFLAKVILQYSQFNSYLQTRCCGCCVGMCCGAVAWCASYDAHQATVILRMTLYNTLCGQIAESSLSKRKWYIW